MRFSHNTTRDSIMIKFILFILRKLFQNLFPFTLTTLLSRESEHAQEQQTLSNGWKDLKSHKKKCDFFRA